MERLDRDWTFDALAWLTIGLGRVGPVRRAIARRMEGNGAPPAPMKRQ